MVNRKIHKSLPYINFSVIEEKLRLFGLNKYEALALLTLIKRGVSSAKEISKHAGVPYSRIYDVLDALEKKGWIVVESTKPLRYQANDIRVILEKLEKRKIAEIKEARKSIIEELKPYFGKHAKKVGVWIIRDEKKIIEKVNEMIKNAKKSLYLMVPYIPEKILSKNKKTYKLLL